MTTYKPRTSLNGAPAARCAATVPADLLAQVDRLAKPIAGGRSEFIRLALAERVRRLQAKSVPATGRR